MCKTEDGLKLKESMRHVTLGMVLRLESLKAMEVWEIEMSLSKS